MSGLLPRHFVPGRTVICSSHVVVSAGVHVARGARTAGMQGFGGAKLTGSLGCRASRPSSSPPEPPLRPELIPAAFQP